MSEFEKSQLENITVLSHRLVETEDPAEREKLAEEVLRLAVAANEGLMAKLTERAAALREALSGQ